MPLDRRTLLKSMPYGAASLVGGWLGLRGRRSTRRIIEEERQAQFERLAEEMIDPLLDEGSAFTGGPPGDGSAHSDPLRKIADFDRPYEDDYFLDETGLALLHSTAARLENAQELVGHGNFNLLSFDRLLRFAQNYEAIGEFSREELDFLEEIFFSDATRYGFFGEKVTTDLTSTIAETDVEKITGSGHYLLKGAPLEEFHRIRRDVGDAVTLTSGVRSVVKQYQLFLAKARETGGNLSQASRSLAPPGFSFHARGDFDVGKAGFGLQNFTATFAETDVYRRLIDLGYVSIRYHETNPFGVRHEPWHIKIA